MKNYTPDQIDSVLKLIIGTTFCAVLLMMSTLSMYSVVFVTQPMTGIAPADKQFFMLLSDMSKYILGALATLLAIKAKDGITKLIDPPAGVSSPKDWQDQPAKPAPAAPAPSSTPAPVARQEQPVEAAPVTTGYGGKKAPPPAPEPEI
jgi:hypothetical protein